MRFIFLISSLEMKERKIWSQVHLVKSQKTWDSKCSIKKITCKLMFSFYFHFHFWVLFTFIHLYKMVKKLVSEFLPCIGINAWDVSIIHCIYLNEEFTMPEIVKSDYITRKIKREMHTSTPTYIHFWKGCWKLLSPSQI